MSIHQEPVDVSIKASLSRGNGILNTKKKGKLGSSNFTMLPGGRIKEIC